MAYQLPGDYTPSPLEATPFPVELTPAPVQMTPSPVEFTPAPVAVTLSPVNNYPVPVTSAPFPVLGMHSPVDTTPFPTASAIRSSLAPADTTPSPTSGPPKSTQPPVDTTPPQSGGDRVTTPSPTSSDVPTSLQYSLPTGSPAAGPTLSAYTPNVKPAAAKPGSAVSPTSLPTAPAAQRPTSAYLLPTAGPANVPTAGGLGAGPTGTASIAAIAGGTAAAALAVLLGAALLLWRKNRRQASEAERGGKKGIGAAAGVHRKGSASGQQSHSRSGSQAGDNKTAVATWWLPNQVVPADKKVANLIWIAMLLCFVALSIWVIVSTYKQRTHPAGSFQYKNGFFPMPDIGVCFDQSEGCRAEPSLCIASALTATISQATPVAGYQQNYTQALQPMADEGASNCMLFRTSELTPVEGMLNTRLALRVQWDLQSNESQSQEYLEAHLKFYQPELTAVERAAQPIAKFVPFAVQPANGSYVTANGLVLTMEERQLLSGETQLYYTSSMTHFPYNAASYELPSSSSALLFVWVNVVAPVYTTLKEVDPVQFGSLLGQIGGLWGYVAALAAVFFVAVQTQNDPQYKVRRLHEIIPGPVLCACCQTRQDGAEVAEGASVEAGEDTHDSNSASKEQPPPYMASGSSLGSRWYSSSDASGHIGPFLSGSGSMRCQHPVLALEAPIPSHRRGESGCIPNTMLEPPFESAETAAYFTRRGDVHKGTALQPAKPTAPATSNGHLSPRY